MSIDDEIPKLPSLLAPVAKTLVQYAQTLANGTLQLKGKRWVFSPHNFVTFQVQWRLKRDIVVTLRGEPREYQVFSELPLSHERSRYSLFRLNSPNQARAATAYIQRAHELYQRGRGRRLKKPVTTET